MATRTNCLGPQGGLPVVDIHFALNFPTKNVAFDRRNTQTARGHRKCSIEPGILSPQVAIGCFNFSGCSCSLRREVPETPRTLALELSGSFAQVAIPQELCQLRKVEGTAKE